VSLDQIMNDELRCTRLRRETVLSDLDTHKREESRLYINKHPKITQNQTART